MGKGRDVTFVGEDHYFERPGGPERDYREEIRVLVYYSGFGLG